MAIPIDATRTPFAATLARTDAPTPSPVPREGPQGSGQAEGPHFGERLREMLEDVNQRQVDADTAATEYANGERNDLHGTMITMEQADISLRLLSNVRTRLVDAYREVMRMGA